MNSKIKQRFKEAYREFWLIKFFIWMFREKKDLCQKCNKNEAQAEFKGKRLCVSCISSKNQKGGLRK